MCGKTFGNLFDLSFWLLRLFGLYWLGYVAVHIPIPTLLSRHDRCGLTDLDPPDWSYSLVNQNIRSIFGQGCGHCIIRWYSQQQHTNRQTDKEERRKKEVLKIYGFFFVSFGFVILLLLLLIFYLIHKDYYYRDWWYKNTDKRKEQTNKTA